MGKFKGSSIADQFLITVIFLAFCMVTVLAYTIWLQMSPALSTTLAASSPGGVISSGTALALSQTNTTLLMFDQLFIFMIVGSFIAIIISSFWLGTHPVFFIISLLSFVFLIGIYAVLGNIYAQFETTPSVQQAASNFPLMEAFWQNIPTIALIFGVIIIIVTYAKIRGGNPNAYSA